jgi:hypothetical protein
MRRLVYFGIAIGVAFFLQGKHSEKLSARGGVFPWSVPDKPVVSEVPSQENPFSGVLYPEGAPNPLGDAAGSQPMVRPGVRKVSNEKWKADLEKLQAQVEEATRVRERMSIAKR